MKESGWALSRITEDEQDRQMARYMGIVKFGVDLSVPLRNLAMQNYLRDHPEKGLLAHVTVVTANWLKRSS
jgi:hypothetical protein